MTEGQAPTVMETPVRKKLKIEQTSGEESTIPESPINCGKSEAVAFVDSVQKLTV